MKCTCWFWYFYLVCFTCFTCRAKRFWSKSRYAWDSRLVRICRFYGCNLMNSLLLCLGWSTFPGICCVSSWCPVNPFGNITDNTESINYVQMRCMTLHMHGYSIHYLLRFKTSQRQWSPRDILCILFQGQSQMSYTDFGESACLLGTIWMVLDPEVWKPACCDLVLW